MIEIKLSPPLDGIVDDFNKKVDMCIERQLAIENEFELISNRMHELESKFFKLVTEEL